jgi:UDP-N-acetylglucosamine 2-epimerase
MVDRELRERGHESIILHTGQHYDEELSQIFFDELKIPVPRINLGIGSGSHAEQTSRAMIGIEKFLLEEKPDWVLVYGDTNSTLAGILVACKLPFKTAHVEAGLRSYNRAMPEEHNRVIVDHCADLLFCPTEVAENNLNKEGVVSGVYFTGDVMLDAANCFCNRQTDVLNKFGIKSKQYLLMTIHRPSVSQDDLISIFKALKELDEVVVFPCHPRFKSVLPFHSSKVIVDRPIGYLDMLELEKHAKLILTDSNGVQREAYFFGIPCLTMRTETELVETVEFGWNVVVGTEAEAIIWHTKNFHTPAIRLDIFGDGQARKHIVNHLEDNQLKFSNCWLSTRFF